MLLARHQANAERLWLGLEQLGIQLYVPSAYRKRDSVARGNERDSETQRTW